LISIPVRQFAEHWWSQRLITVLESFGYGPRLARGRSYARSGAVQELEIRPGEVYASVQGSRRRPYSVTIEVDVLQAEQWGRVEKQLAGRVDLLSALLAGQMPEHIEDAFHDTGLTLFPTRREFVADCTCPDMANPCKHIAATCYVLADRLDEDPFALLAWRGRRKADLISRIEALRDAQAWAQVEASPDPDDLPLAETLGRFWECGQALPELPKAQPDNRPGAILDRLGPLGIGVTGEGPRRGIAAAGAAGRQLALTASDDEGSMPDESAESAGSASMAARSEADLTDLLRPAYAALARR
jgi:uncharacterized Zn finger protein